MSLEGAVKNAPAAVCNHFEEIAFLRSDLLPNFNCPSVPSVFVDPLLFRRPRLLQSVSFSLVRDASSALLLKK